MGRPRALASLLASALLLVAVVGDAQSQPKPTDAQVKKAGELVKAAIAKSQAGEHSAAIDLYLNAYQIVPLAVLLSNIGSEYQQVNKPVEALKYFCKYLDADPTGTNATYATAQAKTLQIQLNGAADDKNVCKPVVKPAPPPPPPPFAGTGTGSAEVGAGSGSSTEFGTTGTSGFEKPPEPPPANHEGRGMKIAGIAAAGVGVIALGLGIKYGLDAQAHTDFENHFKDNNPPGTPWPTNIRAYEQEGHDLNTKQAIFTIGGGVAIISGVVVFMLGRSQAASAEHASLQPTATRSSVGLALTGSF